MKLRFLNRDCWKSWSLVLNLSMVLLITMAIGFLLRETNFNYYKTLFVALPPWLVKLRFAFSVSLRIFMFISALCVVLRLSWARYLMIAYSIFTIVTIHFKHPYSTFEGIFNTLLIKGEVSAEMVPHLHWYAYGLMMLFCYRDVFLAIITIYLLLRKEIVKQFEKGVK